MKRSFRAVKAQLVYLYTISFKLLDYPQISRMAIKKLLFIAKKCQIRLSRDMKRSICKNCLSLLVPLVTSSTKIEKSLCGTGLVVKCKMCGVERRFLVKGQKGLRKSGVSGTGKSA